jgi:prepilin signal peptidase PulO-like enzyme (type II secretory pathway)
MINFLFIAILGLVIGSFLNCLVWRINTKKGIWLGRSVCPRCSHALDWKDLVPLVSWFCLGGKCRYCRQKISWQYPAVEMLTVVVFVLMYFKFGFTLTLLANLITASFLIVIFIYDIKYYLILDRVSLPAIIFAIFSVLVFNYGFMNHLAAAVIGSGFFALQYFLSGGRWVGGGDIRLGFLMGVVLGLPQVVAAIFIAYFLGAIVGVGLLLTKKKKMGSEVPFGAFLVPATLIVILYGNQIMNWYWSIL